MSILHQNRSLLRPDTFSANVPIDANLTREAQFDQWLNLLAPRICPRHKHTTMVLDHEASRRETLSDENSGRWFRRHMTAGLNDFPTATARERLYAFDALFRCPACCLAYARCPPEFHETSFDNFNSSTPEHAATLAKAREFSAQVNTRGRGFAVFVGQIGTGKTRLACNIIRELKCRDALYVRQGELTCALRATYGRKDVILHPSTCQDTDEPDDHPEPLKIVQEAHFLVLDEIGCLPLANDEKLLLDELFKHRYEQGKPTMLVSNLPLTGPPESPGLKEFLGDALADRIRHATGNGKFIVQFTGESYRRTNGESYLNGVD